jgi:hypothetical protein
MRQPDDLRERRGGGQRDQVVFAAPGRPQPALAEQPHLGRGPTVSPVGGRRYPQRREVGGPGEIRPIAPFDAPPRRAGGKASLSVEMPTGSYRASPRGGYGAAAARERDAASACHETPSALGEMPTA